MRCSVRGGSDTARGPAFQHRRRVPGQRVLAGKPGLEQRLTGLKFYRGEDLLGCAKLLYHVQRQALPGLVVFIDPRQHPGSDAKYSINVERNFRNLSNI